MADIYFASASVAFAENKLLDKAKTEKLIASADLQEALKYLRDFGISLQTDSNGKVNTEESLLNLLSSAYSYVDTVSPNGLSSTLWRHTYDCANIKSLLKCRLRGVSADEMLFDFGTVNKENCLAIQKSFDFSAFPKNMSEKAQEAFDLAKQNFNNQTTPLFVSNKGRYIWCDGSFACTIKGGKITIDPHRGAVECIQAGTTLKEAYLAACAKHFPASGQIPPEEFLNVPQYNTWIELIYDQNQDDILKYAHGIIDNGFPAGILMIDDNWQKYYGNNDFKPEKFPDPKAMIDELHSLGFKIMFWVCPFVSPDSQEFRFLRSKGYLVMNAQGTAPAILDWWNGFSAAYDLSNPEAYAYFVGTLKDLQARYGVDGFKFDAGDPERYQEKDIRAWDGKSYDTEQSWHWAKLGLDFPYNEFRACWKMGGEALVQRLGDKSYSWRAVASLVPDMIAAGMLGHIYTCPDMIGGGEFGSFRNVDQSKMDQELIVRSCQIHSMMPMMQFSVAPWRVLDAEHLSICHKFAKLHADMGAYIVEQARNSSKSGEPIVRPMDYSFPGQGFEACTDQYMLGDKYLVAPMLNKGTSRSVALPKGRWQDENGKIYRGGKSYELNVPIDRLPYFVKIK